jgi:hypothetical protein
VNIPSALCEGGLIGSLYHFCKMAPAMTAGYIPGVGYSKLFEGGFWQIRIRSGPLDPIMLGVVG